MNDPSTYWLTFTNIALGVVVLIGCVAVAAAVLVEVAARYKKRAAISAFETGGHAFDLPGLGVTMADGGEEVRSREPRRPS